MNHQNVDSSEIEKFARIAHRWWDKEGEFKPLHAINPARLAFMERHAKLQGRRVLDVGCGGGILCEAMAEKGALVTGIDAGRDAISTARLHAMESELGIEYQESTAEDYAAAHPEHFAIVSCMEMLEHVPHPDKVVEACARLTKPGGKLFFSTINRNAKAFALGVVAAEYVLGLLPRGTHQYEKFIRPSELAACGRECGLELVALSGIHYNPLTGKARLNDNASVNYVMHFSKPA